MTGFENRHPAKAIPGSDCKYQYGAVLHQRHKNSINPAIANHVGISDPSIRLYSNIKPRAQSA